MITKLLSIRSSNGFAAAARLPELSSRSSNGLSAAACFYSPKIMKKRINKITCLGSSNEEEPMEDERTLSLRYLYEVLDSLKSIGAVDITEKLKAIEGLDMSEEELKLNYFKHQLISINNSEQFQPTP